ncbi:MAG: hypothetical protein JSU69_01155 [Candidatus Zixiibacteriota bacterium]|nr:MAG: hypothetical protein JSU69_01155 [candidate division Zixibacteria bacterium]
MDSLDLLAICGSAFLSVFLLLAFLAVIMRLIIAIFPEKLFAVEAAVLAAIASAVGSLYPGTKVTKIEEAK